LAGLRRWDLKRLPLIIAGLDPGIHPLSQEDGCARHDVEDRFNLSGSRI
jgi:hypothetical protein